MLPMSTAPATSDIPKNPAQRREWIRMHLRISGLTWRELARRIGVSPQAVQQTAGGKPSVPIERALSAALGIAPQVLFSEHWTPQGARIPIERATFRRAKNSNLASAVHDQRREVA